MSTKAGGDTLVSKNRPNIVVCIPAKDEEKTIASVVIKAMKNADKVIVCDDGSADMTAEIAERLGAEVIRHIANLGKGEALRTLMIEARKLRPKVVVSLDSDGQHDADEIAKVAEPVLHGEADVVIGVRSMEPGIAPRDRIFGNKILDLATVRASGGKNKSSSTEVRREYHDTQSGFRAYSLEALDKIDFTQNGMAIESQTFMDALSANLRIKEVPIKTTYQGIVPRRSRLNHFSQVIDYIITRTVADSPLLYLGLPGIVGIILGVLAGLRVIEIFVNHQQIAAGTALIAVCLIIIGAVLTATSVIIKLLKMQALRS